MTGLKNALTRSRSIINTAAASGLRLRQSGNVEDILTPSTQSLFGGMRSTAGNRERYSQFRGWLYAAINVLAEEAAGQQVNVGKLTGTTPRDEDDERMRRMRLKGSWAARKAANPSIKAAHTEMELLLDHPLLDTLQQPNPAQNGWQFVYSFAANLKITGWAFIVADVKDGKQQLYSLPTTWVRPVHKKGLFAQFRIVDPKDPAAASTDDKDLIDRSQVAFAGLPNPSDPLSMLAPAAAQSLAIQIDDHIQTSQERFFENGVFPSMIITIGKNPMGDNRPRLSGSQRRGIISAIRKTSGGVMNYGHPAIIDGLIERIDRLSATSTEMGWEKSEAVIKTRILSAYGVHPFRLGEPISVGGYAQAAIIDQIFCKRVNTILTLLGTTVNHFTAAADDATGRIKVWWEECEPHDPALRAQNMREGRKNGDISQNEYRAFVGLPPDEDNNEDVIGKNAAAIRNMMTDLGNGTVSRQQAEAYFRGLGIPNDDAAAYAARAENDESLGDAVEALESAVAALSVDPKRIAGRLVEMAR